MSSIVAFLRRAGNALDRLLAPKPPRRRTPDSLRVLYAQQAAVGPHAPGSMEWIYQTCGKEILGAAATSAALSDAIAAQVAHIRQGMQETEPTATLGELRIYLGGYAYGAALSAALRPDLQMESFTSFGYSEAAVRFGALCQVAFAEGLLKMEPQG
ncbi:hypothetical protein [Streptosporangium canum]|uniref:hypothetical protein n=1 Tax=Streptosporangium canum TaxID=324952 RepID=UPI003794C810